MKTRANTAFGKFAAKILPALGVLAFSSACQQALTPSGAGDGSESGLSSVEVGGLPEKSKEKFGANAKLELLTHIAFSIVPKDPNCQGATRVEGEVRDYAASLTIADLKIKNHCDYIFALALGKKLDTVSSSTSAAAAIVGSKANASITNTPEEKAILATLAAKIDSVYASLTPVQVKSVDLKLVGSSTFKFPIKVLLTKLGEDNGFNENVSTSPASSPAPQPSASPLPVVQVAPIFKDYKIVAGNSSKSLADVIKGAYVLVDYSASWCAPCRSLASTLLVPELKPSGIMQQSMQQGKCSVVTITGEDDITRWTRLFPSMTEHTFSEPNTASNPKKTIAGKAITAFPTTELYEVSTGKVVNKWSGAATSEISAAFKDKCK